MIEELNFYNKKLSKIDTLKKWFLVLSIIFIIASIIGVILSVILPLYCATLEGIGSGAITPDSTDQEIDIYFENSPHFLVMTYLLTFFALLFLASVILIILRFSVLIFYGKKYFKLLKETNKLDMEIRHKRKHTISS